MANASPGDPGVSDACGSTTGHRFLIEVTGDLFNRAGQSIFMYGISQSAGPNNELNGSGHYLVPTTTTNGNLDDVSPGGYTSGWAFDYLRSDASIQVAIFADGDGGQGAETGSLVWLGPADQQRPDVNSAYQITGNHGFAVQLPAWVANNVHSLSAYAVSVNGALAPLAASPEVPGGRTIASQFSWSTSSQVFQSFWYGYNLPAGPANLVSLSGTVSLYNSANIFSEIMFAISDLATGECPTAGTDVPPSVGSTSTFWTDIIKAPTAGTFSVPVNFTLPVGLPIRSDPPRPQGCLLVGLGGGTVAGPHLVIGTVNLLATYTQTPTSTAQPMGLGGEFCFGQNWGCQLATTDNSKSFAVVTQISQRSSLRAIWGNISDSTFDGSSNFAAPPTAPWTATNDVYVYHWNRLLAVPVGH